MLWAELPMEIQGKEVWSLPKTRLTDSVPGTLPFAHGLDRVREGVCAMPWSLRVCKRMLPSFPRLKLEPYLRQ